MDHQNRNGCKIEAALIFLALLYMENINILLLWFDSITFFCHESSVFSMVIKIIFELQEYISGSSRIFTKKMLYNRYIDPVNCINSTCGALNQTLLMTKSDIWEVHKKFTTNLPNKIQSDYFLFITTSHSLIRISLFYKRK